MRDFVVIACVLLTLLAPGCESLSGGGGGGAKLKPLLTVGEYRVIVATMLAEIRVLGGGGGDSSDDDDDGDGGDSADSRGGSGAIGSPSASTPPLPQDSPPAPDPSAPQPPRDSSPPVAIGQPPKEEPPTLPPPAGEDEADDADASSHDDSPEPPRVAELPPEGRQAKRPGCDVAPPKRRFSFVFDGTRYTLDRIPDAGQQIDTDRATFIVRDDPKHSTGRRVEVLRSKAAAAAVGSSGRPYEPGDEVTYPRRAGYVEPKYGTFDYPFPDVWTHLRTTHGINADHLSRREAERLHDSVHR